jgi:putative transposase
MQQQTESRSDWMMKRFEFSAKSNARNSVYQLWTHEMSLRIAAGN